MSERKWVPEFYVDEISPPGRASPSAWIVPLPGHVYGLAPPDEDSTSDPRVLHDGEVMHFAWTEDFGEAMFRVGENRTWTVDRQPPPGTTHVCAYGDPESMGYGLEEFATDWIDNDPDPGQEVIVHYYAWSEKPELFRFKAGEFQPAPTA